jgi:hypothetical protein
MYDLLSTDAKLSGSRFHTILQRQTNNISPHHHRSRLRELLRVARQFMFLQVLKRAGQTNRRSAGLGDLALRCPACPLLDVNYIHMDVTEGLECVLFILIDMQDLDGPIRYLFWQQISYDGSFQLTRKNKVVDKHDTCLTDSSLYWVSQQHYRTHLSINDSAEYEKKASVS